MNEIPYSSKESFVTGRSFVTTKDNVFEPSDPFCHAAEFMEILRTHYSEDGINLSEEILLMFTDGVGDHNITRVSTQVPITCLFIYY